MKGVDGMRSAFYGSPHGAFIGQVPWVRSKRRDLLGLLHGIRSVEISVRTPSMKKTAQVLYALNYHEKQAMLSNFGSSMDVVLKPCKS